MKAQEQRQIFQRGPLTPNQRRGIFALAKRAWNHQTKMGLTDEFDSVDDWRHEQQREACKLESMREATQIDFLLLRAHYKILLGEDDGAFSDLMRSGGVAEDCRLLLWLIADECRRSEGMLNYPVYPAAIARRQYGKSSLESCNPKELEQLLWTVVNRHNQKKRRGRK